MSSILAGRNAYENAVFIGKNGFNHVNFQLTHPLNREWPVTTRQLSNYLQVSMRTLLNWRRDGKIPYWRLTARAIRYNLFEVEQALGKPDALEE